MNPITITPEDFDRSSISVPLEYRRGEPPPGFATKVTLNVPDADKVVKLIRDFLQDRNVLHFLNACMPAHLCREEFLNLLTPGCLFELLRVSQVLCIGEKAFRKIVNQAAGLPDDTESKITVNETAARQEAAIAE